MLGIHAKRGIATTLERVFKNTGNTFNKLDVFWTGKTAGIIFSRYGAHALDAKLIFPAIDETAQISSATFSNMIGYALHELGHAWFTDNEPWDKARSNHGGYVSALINGLEDPRIERSVIESGYAPNSRTLFEDLINSVLAKGDPIDPSDKSQIPFLLAVEGRRLNGYAVNVPCVIDQSPYAKHLHWALNRAHKATDTESIVRIALQLFKRLKDQDDQPTGDGDQQQQGQDQQQGQQGDKQDGQQQGQGSEPSDQQGDQQQGQGDDGQGDGDAQDGQGKPSDQQGQQGGKPDDQPSDQPSNKGGGKGTFDDPCRDVEPTKFIEDELLGASSAVDNHSPRPIVLKPSIQTFDWI